MKTSDLNQKQQNIYMNLERQIDSFFKHTNEKSFKTRERYSDGMHDFAKFLAKEFRKENIKSIKNKHIEAYITHMQKNPGEYSTSYITTNLSAIRFFYHRVTDGKLHIKTNRQLNVVPRTQTERIGKNRSIDKTDSDSLIAAAEKASRMDYFFILKLGELFGLRLHEAFSLRKSQINEALRTNQIHIKGKGGLIRTLPLNYDQKKLLENIKNQIHPVNDRIFIGENQRTHLEIKKFQAFIRNSKKNGTSSTYHSLRHSFAQNLYKNLIASGLSDIEARSVVSERLGHHRIEITKIYLNM